MGVLANFKAELVSLSLWRAVFAELVSSVIFLIAVNTSAYHGDTVSISLAIGLSIATLAQCIGHVSGGYINPALVFGMMLVGKISPLRGLLFIVAQCGGGVAGSAAAWSIVPEANRSGMAVNKIADGMSAWQGFGLELVFTFMLVLTVFAVTDGKRKVQPYGVTLAIGISIVVSHLAMIPLTGCGINPARSLGPAVISNMYDDHWVYWAGPLLGGGLAGLTYTFVFYVDDSASTCKHDDIDRLTAIELKEKGNHESYIKNNEHA